MANNSAHRTTTLRDDATRGTPNPPSVLSLDATGPPPRGTCSGRAEPLRQADSTPCESRRAPPFVTNRAVLSPHHLDPGSEAADQHDRVDIAATEASPAVPTLAHARRIN